MGPGTHHPLNRQLDTRSVKSNYCKVLTIFERKPPTIVTMQVLLLGDLVLVRTENGDVLRNALPLSEEEPEDPRLEAPRDPRQWRPDRTFPRPPVFLVEGPPSDSSMEGQKTREVEVHGSAGASELRARVPNHELPDSSF